MNIPGMLRNPHLPYLYDSSSSLSEARAMNALRKRLWVGPWTAMLAFLAAVGRAPRLVGPPKHVTRQFIASS